VTVKEEYQQEMSEEIFWSEHLITTHMTNKLIDKI